MTKKPEKPAVRTPDKYRHVEITTLDRGRRGKHYELVKGIIQQLKVCGAGVRSGNTSRCCEWG